MREHSIQVGFARQMRHEPTPSEQRLWGVLRRNQLEGLTFRRQHPIAQTRFIADFCCPALKLIVEIDGGYHNEVEQSEQDKIREELIAEFGYTFVRFTNEQIMNDMTNVLQAIRTAAVRFGIAPLSPCPFPPADGEKGEYTDGTSRGGSNSPFSPSAGGKGQGDRGETQL